MDRKVSLHYFILRFNGEFVKCIASGFENYFRVAHSGTFENKYDTDSPLCVLLDAKGLKM